MLITRGKVLSEEIELKIGVLRYFLNIISEGSSCMKRLPKSWCIMTEGSELKVIWIIKKESSVYYKMLYL